MVKETIQDSIAYLISSDDTLSLIIKHLFSSDILFLVLYKHILILRISRSVTCRELP